VRPDPPSPFLEERLGALRQAAGRGAVVDLACGRGRHALALARAGIPVVGLDRDGAALVALRAAARSLPAPVHPLRADLEGAPAPPLRPGCCGALLVFRYLHRPLAPALARLLAPGGLLLYETFTIHQRSLGQGPRNPDFLLEPGELAQLFPELELLHSWEGTLPGPRPAAVARLAARRPEAGLTPPRP